MALDPAVDAGASTASLPSDARSLPGLQARALQEMLNGCPLPAILATLAQAAEANGGACGAACILLAESSGKRLEMAAAPSLPPSFGRLAEGLEADGPVATAMATGRKLIAVDLETVPDWRDLAQLPRAFGFQAAWWRPIIGSHGVPLGTFGVFLRRRGGPTAPEMEVVDVLAPMAALAIERASPARLLPGVEAENRQRQRVADAVVATTPDLVYAFDLQHRFTYANHALLSMWGKTWEESVGRTCLELGYEPWHAAMHDREIDTVVATKRSIRGEVAFHGTNGRRYYDYIFAPVLNAAGEVEAIAGTTRDVTDQRRAAAAGRFLADLTQRLAVMTEEREIVRSAVGALGAHLNAHRCYFVEFDAGSDHLIVSPNWLRDGAASLEGTMRTFEFGGAELGQVVGGGPVTVSDTHDDPRLGTIDEVRRFDAMQIRSFASQPVNEQGIVLAVTDDKPRVWTSEELVLLESVAARVWPLVARTRSETALRIARDEALAGLRAKDAFLATLSHELRTPLNPVLLLASDAAADATLPAGVRADFATIAAHVSLEARMIDDLLDLTRIAHDKLPLQLAREDLHALLGPVLAAMQLEAEAKGLTFIVALDAADHAVVGDEVRLKQIFWNLIRNAIKFTPAPGRVTVATRLPPERPGKVEVRVSDTGIGVSPEEAPHLFKAFAQGEHSRKGGGRFGGLGLGLAISRKLAEIHSGSLTMESGGRDQGATFVMELPLADAAAVPARPAGTAEPAAGPDLRRILLVEDHPGSRQALAYLLRNRQKEVWEASTLVEARQLAAEHRFDLVISDIGLPDGTGYELMAAVKPLLGCPGIALSGYGASEDVAKSVEAGFAVHLTKPVDIHALNRAIRQLTPVGA